MPKLQRSVQTVIVIGFTTRLYWLLAIAAFTLSATCKPGELMLQNQFFPGGSIVFALNSAVFFYCGLAFVAAGSILSWHAVQRRIRL